MLLWILLENMKADSVGAAGAAYRHSGLLLIGVGLLRLMAVI